MFKANQKTIIADEEYLNCLQQQKIELRKERYKLQTEKLENNRWLRENARDDLIMEKIIDAIYALPPLEIPNQIKPFHGKKGHALMIADAHYGVEYCIRGLYGEVINEYSPEIFEARMWDLLNQTIELINKEQITCLNVFDLADAVDGVLRVGQLMKLRYGVIEASVRYADFLSNWINELTKYVFVEFQMTRGNHSELRMLGQPKGTFKDENTSIFIREMIEARLSNNPNFHMTKNPTGYIFTSLCGYNILGIHGEVKNLCVALKEFAHKYKTKVDFLIAGHKHHASSETVGVDQEVIGIPSIIGIDDFSFDINKTSNAGATMLVFEEGKGKVCEYSIKLN